MRIIVTTDRAGGIVALATAPEGAPRPGRGELADGEQEIEIDSPEITEDMDGAEVENQLAALAESSRVNVAARTFESR